jgi:ribose transport system ATP-binding protein
VAHIPSDRKRLGLMLDKTVWENITAVTALAGAGTGTRTRAGSGRWLRRTALRALARQWMDELRIRGQLDAPVATLSGGNQQKVVLTKWLLSKSMKLLMLDHPTRGLDPGARSDLFVAVRELADKGLAILLVGDTLDEVLSLSDEILVMKDGEITASFSDVQASPPSEEELVRAMV